MVRWSKTPRWGKTPLTDFLRRSLSISPGYRRCSFLTPSISKTNLVFAQVFGYMRFT